VQLDADVLAAEHPSSILTTRQAMSAMSIAPEHRSVFPGLAETIPEYHLVVWKRLCRSF
jgi:hypothetical protein